LPANPLNANEIVAERAPAAVGRNLASTIQVLPGCKTIPFWQVVFAAVMGKSPGLVPASAAAGVPNVIATPEPLISVKSPAKVATPTICDPKLIAVGWTITSPTPVPVNGSICGLPAASLLISIEAERAPTAVGINDIETKHVPPGASVTMHDEVVNSEALVPLN